MTETKIPENYIEGTDNDDHINPKSGHGRIATGAGVDVVVISEGDFYNINGFQDQDYHPEDNSLPDAFVKKNINFKNRILKALGEEGEIKAPEQDQLLIFIEPEKMDSQKVQMFRRDGATYARIIDVETGEILAGTRAVGNDFEVKIVSENGEISMKPEIITDEEEIDDIAYDINTLITRGEVNRDKGLLEGYFARYMDKSTQEELDENYGSNLAFRALAESIENSKDESLKKRLTKNSLVK